MVERLVFVGERLKGPIKLMIYKFTSNNRCQSETDSRTTTISKRLCVICIVEWEDRIPVTPQSSVVWARLATHVHKARAYNLSVHHSDFRSGISKKFR